MSKDRMPSEQQLGKLRTLLVRFRFHCEDAGLWPGAVAKKHHRAFEASLAARAFLYLFREVEAMKQATQETFRIRRGDAKPTCGGWSLPWLADIWRAARMLSEELHDVAGSWLVTPRIDWETLYAKAEHQSVDLPRRDYLEQVTEAIADRNWEAHFCFLWTDESRFEKPKNADEAIARHSRLMGDNLDEWRLTVECAAFLDRCVRRLDEILTHGAKDQDFGTYPDDEPLFGPLAVTIPPATDNKAGARKGMCVLVLDQPKQIVSVAQMKLIVALVENSEFGLSHDEAKRIHTNASRVLNKLCKEDSDWRRAIELPRKGKGGYRIRSRGEAVAA